MAKPIVAIVGRPNVGKSTLFNRLVGGMTAIVEDVPGVTRDRLYRDVNWVNVDFTLVDTGGISLTGFEDSIVLQMKAQAELAIQESDLVLFVVDGRAGLLSDDFEIADILRRSSKPLILVVNKIEDFKNKALITDFYTLGMGDPLPVSAAHGMNTGDLLDRIVQHLPIQGTDPDNNEDAINVAFVGRPNVGKSSLVNALLGEQRVIVSDTPGTTRDAIDTYISVEGQRFILVDTAGMRRKGKIEVPTERYSVIRSLRAIDRAEVALLIIDASEGLTEQDKKIAGYMHESGKAAIVVINKWDLIVKDDKTLRKFEEGLRNELGFLQYAPVIFVSAVTKQRIHKILELCRVVAEHANLRVSTANLNKAIEEAVQLNPPPTNKGRMLKIFYSTQSGTKPPTFVLFVNDPELMHFSYLRYLENKIRQSWDFSGTPIKIIVRKRDQTGQT
ncbi:MAG: ribosome biogenesis GTPase Der [Syntrophomonadaceae bacterium]|nr:ribosome biogenesis GTPase Der [Syntrophomonadaceae bacterium]